MLAKLRFYKGSLAFKLVVKCDPYNEVVMSDAVSALLDQLETELKHQQLWSDSSPDALALASTLPFCCDTLRLEQWLQFIFLPRLRLLLETRQALPAKVSVLPYAEEVFKAQQSRVRPLLSLIARIDIALSGEP